MLSDPKNAYELSKVLVTLLNSYLTARDIDGAHQLVSKIDDFITLNVPPSSILFAKYKLLVAHVQSFTIAHALSAQALKQAQSLIAKVDVEADAKLYDLTTANSLASATLVLAGDVQEAERQHAVHPMQEHKLNIIERGSFLNYQEFFFAVSDVFIGAILKSAPDPRWRPLFELEPKWKLPELEEPTFARTDCLA